MKTRLAALFILAALPACNSVDYDAAKVAAVPRPLAETAISDASIVPLAQEEALHAANAEQASYASAKRRFGDRDPFDFGRNSPHGHAVHGVDVAKYQGAVNWSQAKSSGVSFAFIKATEGGDRVDDGFAQNWASAKARGIPRGAYHFFYFCRPAFEQARWFIKHVPNDPSALPPVLDMEWNPDSPSCKMRPKPEAVRKEMSVFLQMVERHYGKKPIIYVTPDFFEDNGLSSFKGYPYWLRSTAGHPTAKYDGHPWLFWQYTATGKVPGITGDADINVFRGSASDWTKWLSANAG